MPQPTLSQVHVNRPLTQISIAYIQDEKDFIAGEVFPVVPVDKQSDIYFIYKQDDFQRNDVKERAPATESAGSGFNLSTSTAYNARDYALHVDVPDRLRANADSPLDLDRDATLLVTQQMLINREAKFVTKYLTTGVWTGSSGGGDQTGVSSGPTTNQFLQWDQSASTPIEDVAAQMDAMKGLTGKLPTTLTLQRQVFTKLKNHPAFRDLIKYGASPDAPAVVTAKAMAAVWGLERVVIAQAVQNTAIEGQSDSTSFIAPKAALLTYSPKAPSILTPSAGYIFQWKDPDAGTYLAPAMRKFRMEELRADRVEGQQSFDVNQVAAGLGCYFTSAIA